jgi:hypothetical protein
VRVVSWNINYRGPETAERQGDLLRELAPHLMLLQEVNPGSSEILSKAARSLIKRLVPASNVTPVTSLRVMEH